MVQSVVETSLKSQQSNPPPSFFFHPSRKTLSIFDTFAGAKVSFQVSQRFEIHMADSVLAPLSIDTGATPVGRTVPEPQKKPPLSRGDFFGFFSRVLRGSRRSPGHDKSVPMSVAPPRGCPAPKH